MDLNFIVAAFDKIFTNDNIAIVVLSAIVLIQWRVIWKLFSVVLNLKDVMQNVAVALNELNTRLNKGHKK